MENLIFAMGIAAITFALAYQLASLIKEQKKLKKDIQKMEDFNVEFKGMNGTISKEKKQYPSLELDDDWRTGVSNKMMEGEPKEHFEPTLSELRDAQDREERHSISGHMNDPSEEQKRAFLKTNGVPE